MSDYDDAMARLDEFDAGGHYDRAGNPITLSQWLRYFDAPEHLYQRVRLEEIGDYRVSTVWIGIDHGFGMTERPIIFETMVFKDGEGVDQCRYATEEEAIEGHESLVEQMRLIEAALEKYWEPS